MSAFCSDTCLNIFLVNIRPVLAIVTLNGHLSRGLDVLNYILEIELVTAEVAE